MKDTVYKLAVGIIAILLFVFVLVPYTEQKANDPYLDFLKEYPLLEVKDEVRGRITYVDNSENGLRKGLGSAVEIDFKENIYLNVNREIFSGYYIFNVLDEGDSVFKKRDSDTLYLKKEKGGSFLFLLK